MFNLSDWSAEQFFRESERFGDVERMLRKLRTQSPALTDQAFGFGRAQQPGGDEPGLKLSKNDHFKKSLCHIMSL
jgi:hypothetical protein